ncbi:MAG: TIGR02206 family membrane protein [Clostridiales bacterium]|nr:TIGR02206 family membrane protein [Clostridiales bacterium]
MLNFFSYFFGQGDEVEFRNFTLAHFLPIIIMLGIIALIIIYGKKIRELKCEGRIRFTLAFIAIISEFSYYWRLVGVTALETSPVDHLPISVCGWAIIFGSFLVLTKNQTLFDIVYFWASAGSIFALFTPTVITYCGPTRFRYYQFWIAHTMEFIIIFYMMFVHNMRPNVKSIFKSFALLLVLGGVAILANNLLPGANYLFMAKPEDTKSILDFLPKNYVLRVFLMLSVVGILFFVAYLPWLILDHKRKKNNLPPVFTPNTFNVDSNEITENESSTKA